MPFAGDRSPHPCPRCGEPMYWTEAAVRSAADVEYVDAYSCANGHTSEECPLCGSYDTAAWSDAESPRHYHVICAACGNDSVVQV